jgi:hypothetical protein
MDETAYEALQRTRAELRAANARADAAETLLWDRFMCAAITGILTTHDPIQNPRVIVEAAEKVAIQAILARRRFQAGESPNAPPKAVNPRPLNNPMIDRTPPTTPRTT